MSTSDDMLLCIRVHMCLYHSVWPRLFLRHFLQQSMPESLRLFRLCLSVSLSQCLLVSPFLCLLQCLGFTMSAFSICLFSVCLSVCLSFCPSFCLSFCLSFYRPVRLSLSSLCLLQCES